MLDTTLANWVINNLDGIPTTVLVDNEAMIISEKIEGVKTADEYKQIILNGLETIN